MVCGVCVCVLHALDTHLPFLALPVESTWKQRHHVTMSTTNSQILVPKYHPPLKEPGLLKEVPDPRPRARTATRQDEPGTSCSSRILGSVQRLLKT